MLPITIVIADDHVVVRKSLRLLIEQEPDLLLLGEAADGLEAIQAVHTLRPDLLLLDINMPRMSGLEVLKHLRHEKHSLAIVILSNHPEPFYVEAAMRWGANAFVSKSSGLDRLLEAIRATPENMSSATPLVEVVLNSQGP
jgi:DNA-binding NarL/FixJ family response regulator